MTDYAKTTWVDKTTPGTGTPFVASTMNHGETQYDTAKAEYLAGSWGAPPAVPAANLTGRLALTHMTAGTSGEFLKAQGAGVDPVFAALVASDIPVIDTAKVSTGIFAVPRGGTGLSSIAQGGILYASGADTLSRIAPSGANQVLRSTGANALEFAALGAADIPNLAGTILTSGTVDGDRLPAMSQTKQGAVPLTGVPTGTKYLCDDSTFKTPAGAGGGVTGPGSSTNHAVAKWNGTGGDAIENSLLTVDDSGTANIPAGQTYNVNGSQHTHAAADVASGRLTAGRLLDGTVGTFLKAAGAGSDPAYASLSSSDWTGRITAAQMLDGTNDHFLKAAGGGSSPAYAALTSTDIPSLDTAKITTGRFAQTQMPTGTGFLKAASGDPAYTALAAADLPTVTPAYGGTGQTSVPTKGDILVGGSSIFNELTVGANGTVLTANSAATYGVDWEAPPTGYNSTADYIIYKSGTTYYAKSTTGGTNYSGSEVCAVIQSAATALTTTGGVIYIKKNPSPTVVTPTHWRGNLSIDYDLNSGATINIPEGVSVVADGVVFDCRSRNNTIFIFNPSVATYSCAHWNIKVCGMFFYGAVANTTCKAIQLKDYAGGIIVEGIEALCVAYPIEVYGECYWTAIRGCNFGYALAAITLTVHSQGPNGTVIYGNNIEASTVGVTGSGYNICIESNWFESNNTCITVPAAHIEGNYFGLSGLIGISCASMGSRIIGNEFVLNTVAKGIVFTDDYLYNIIADNLFSVDGGSIGIDLTAQTHNSPVITGNHFQMSGASHAISGAFNRALMVANRFQGGSSSAVLLSGCSNSTITGNQFYGMTTGMDLTAFYVSTIVGNDFTDNTTDLIVNSSNGSGVVVGNLFKNTVTPGGAGIMKDNTGYICNVAGTKQFTAAATLVVPHGLSSTPTKIVVTGSNADSATLWVDTIGATNFTVNRGNTTGTPWIYWYAEV